MWKEASAAAGQGVEGLAEGLAIDDVVHVGRSWFRMTPGGATPSGDDDAIVVRAMPVSKTARLGEIVVPATSDDMTARSLFEDAFSMTAPADEVIADRPRRTVTVSLWGLATLGAALVLTGAAVTMMLRPRPASVAESVVSAPAVSAPVVTTKPVVSTPVVAAPAPVPPAAQVIVEPPAAEPPSPPSEVVAAEPPAPTARPSLVRKAPLPVLTPVRRLRPAAPPKAATAVATVPDPFAPPPAKKAWVDPFAE